MFLLSNLTTYLTSVRNAKITIINNNKSPRVVFSRKYKKYKEDISLLYFYFTHDNNHIISDQYKPVRVL